MVNRKSLGFFVASTIMIFIYICVHPLGANARARNEGQLSRRVATAICTVAKNFATSNQIQPPLNDASKFSNEDDAQPCQRLQWKTCGGGDCQKFELKDCPAPKGSKLQIKTRKLKVKKLGANIVGGTDAEPQIKTRKLKPKKLTAKIMGGTEAEPNEFPHQVIFYIPLPFDEVGRCGGSILNKHYILSAAHCFYNKGPKGMIVTAGDHNINEHEGPEQNRSIKSIVIHKGFVQKTKENDIALLKLMTPLALSSKVRPVRVANKYYLIPRMATATGWGALYYGGGFDEENEILQKVDVPIVLWPKCKQIYQKERINVFPTNICAGAEELDSCQGDSGGPLAVKAGKGNFDLIGIVSHGFGCGYPGFPGIYTFVPHYIDWIKKNMK